MTPRKLQSTDTQPFSIGETIRNEMLRQGRSVAWLARAINCDRRNIYHIFSRSSIDTALLWRLSQVLGCDFFAAYTSAMASCRPSSTPAASDSVDTPKTV